MSFGARGDRCPFGFDTDALLDFPPSDPHREAIQRTTNETTAELQEH